MNFSECIEKGLIKKGHNAPTRAGKSLEISEKFLEQAKGNLKMKFYIACELLSYNSSFHCARALLFSRGYVERSHVCLILALKHLYKNDFEIMNLLNILDQLRLSRHNVQYGGSLVSKEKAKTVVSFASNFYSLVNNKLKKLKNDIK